MGKDTKERVSICDERTIDTRSRILASVQSDGCIRLGVVKQILEPTGKR